MEADGERGSEGNALTREKDEWEQRTRTPDVDKRNSTNNVVKADHEVPKSDKQDSDVTDVRMEVPDGGWGWVVAVASALIMILIPVMGPCFGILFSRYLLVTGTSSTTTSWIFGVQTFVWNLSTLFMRGLSMEFGWRAVAIVGSFMASFGFIITSFTPAPEFLFFSFSILGGIGGGLVTGLCFVVVPSYFKRRRGVAHAIMSVGGGAGQIIVPPLIIFLQNTYGDRGATLVYSGIMLHACVAAATFHPVEWHMKSRSVKTTRKQNGDGVHPTNPQTSPSAKSSKSIIFVRVAKSVLSDLRVLRSKRACIVCVSGSMVICNILNFQMMVPFAMQDIGLSLEASAWSLSGMAIASVITRFAFALLSDLSFFNVRACYVSGCAIIAISSAVFPLLRSRKWLMVVMVAYGTGLGANMAMYSLMMIDVMGMHRLARVFGTTSFGNGIALVIFSPLIGMIRDASQSYAVSIWVLSTMAACGTLLWTLMGRATKYDMQKSQESLDL